MMYKLYLIFLVVSLTVSIGLQLVLPFPWGLGVAIGIFILLPWIVKKYAVGRMQGLGRFGGFETAKLIKLCGICGKKTNHRECPRCGSRQFKIG